MMRGSILFLVTAICAWNLPATAQACGIPEPPEPALGGVVPSSGVHPNNVPISISGKSLDLEALTITVDGMPASAKGGYSFLIEPTPEPGQEIRLEGSLCSEGCVVDVTLTAGPPDLEAPAPLASVFLSVHDYPNIPSNDGSCQFGSDLAFWIEYTQTQEGPQGASAFEIYPSNNPDQVIRTITGASGGATSVGLSESALGGIDPLDLCVRAYNYDSANNHSETIESCGLCKHRVEDGPEAQLGDPAPPEPIWHAGDLVAEGSCPDAVLDPEPGATTTDGTETSSIGDSDTTTGEADGEGCGCRTQPTHGLMGSLVVIALVGGMGRRRRRPLHSSKH